MAKEKKKTKKRNIWNWMDGFRGDKVVLIIALLLMLISVISVFSSTPLLALETGVDRIGIMTTQLKVVLLGVVVILVLYIFGRSGLYRWLGKYCYRVHAHTHNSYIMTSIREQSALRVLIAILL